VPSVMELLGKANWWLPRPLARVLPRTPLTEDEAPAEARVPVPAGDCSRRDWSGPPTGAGPDQSARSDGM